MNIILINFVLSFLICLIVINLSKKFKYFLDQRHQNIQKIHKDFIPRLGGISFISFFSIFLFYNSYLNQDTFILFFIPLLIILLGLIEDISESINPRLRAILSALIIVIIISNFNYKIESVNIPLIDSLLNYSYFSFLFIFLCIFLSIHSYNLIDGLNGLSSGYSMIVLIILLFLFIKYDVTEYQLITQALLGSLIGFYVLNFPFPKIFLGDSGSYFLGLLIAILSIIASNVIPNISPWFFALLYVYPLTEFVFSFFRRVLLLKNPFYPDFFHLHSLFYTYLSSKIFSE